MDFRWEASEALNRLLYCCVLWSAPLSGSACQFVLVCRENLKIQRFLEVWLVGKEKFHPHCLEWEPSI